MKALRPQAKRERHRVTFSLGMRMNWFQGLISFVRSCRFETVQESVVIRMNLFFSQVDRITGVSLF